MLNRNKNPIFKAIRDNDIDSVKTCLKCDIDLSQTNEDGQSALHCAAMYNKPEIAALLVKHGASLTLKNRDKKTPFDLACESDYFECADICFADKARYVDYSGGKWGGLFLQAILYRNLTYAKKLYQAGASIAARTRKDNRTALQHAIYREDFVKFLLEIGASLTALDDQRYTPLEWAVTQRAWAGAELMINFHKDAKLTEKELADLHFEEALLIAIMHDNYSLTKLLLEHGAPCQQSDSYYGNIALAKAIICSSQPDIITLLLEHGADPNQRNKAGKTSLDVARTFRRPAHVQRLAHFDAGTSPERINNLATTTNILFDGLLKPDCKPGDILLYMVAYSVIELELLANDLKALQAQRNLLKLHAEKHQAEIATLDRQIAAVQQLLNYPEEDKIQIDEQFRQTIPGGHIQDHLDHMQKIHDFTARVKAYLLSLHLEIQSRTWHVKSFLNAFTNKWNEGTPEHIKLINQQLAKFTNHSTAIDVCVIYADIASILEGIKDNWLRHADTNLFFQEQKRRIHDLHFLAPDLAQAAHARRGITIV